MADRTIIKNSGSNAVYGLGMIGALVYYISTADGLLGGLWGIIQAILWPAFLVYEVMEYLTM